MDEVKKGRLPAAILLLTLIAGLLAAGCGQKEMEPPKHELAGKELAELSAWPERETYDEAFHDSRNATLALWTQTCSCGAEGISCRQSYTEASLGASAVRECPLGQMPAKDNQMTEEYVESFYCPSCGKRGIGVCDEGYLALPYASGRAALSSGGNGQSSSVLVQNFCG